MKVSIRFSLTPGTSSDLPIRIRISYDGKRLDIRTGYVCPPAAWDERTSRMLPNTTNRYNEQAIIINAALTEQELAIRRILNRYDLERTIPEPSQLKDDFNNELGRKKRKRDKDLTILALYDKFMKERSKEKSWSTNTTNSYLALRIRLTDRKIANKQISSFSTEDIKFIQQKFINEGSLNSTTSRMIGYLNSFLNWCKENELYNGKTLKSSLKGSSVDNTINYLEWDEVLRIKDLELLRTAEIITRDTFCFQCFTGLRTSDVQALTWSQVHLDEENPYISVTTIKTDDSIKIELNDLAIEIIQRYNHSSVLRHKVFPDIGTHCKNDNLPRIAHQAHITGTITRTSFCGSKRIEETIQRADAITTHWGRHTFIVHALSIGISPIVVMSWTGHSDYESMQPYINIVDSVKVESMKKFNISPQK